MSLLGITPRQDLPDEPLSLAGSRAAELW